MESRVSGTTDVALTELTIGQAFDESVACRGDRLALVVPHQRVHWTWSELGARVDAFANALIRLGFSPGDRIGVWATNQWEWVVAQFATAKAGLILVSINPAYRLSELEYVLNKVGCRGLITGVCFKTSDYIAMLQELMPELATSPVGETASARVRTLETVIRLGDESTAGMYNFGELVESEIGKVTADLAKLGRRLNNHDAINIQFTSGTTGSPKGATLTHRNVLNNARFIGETLGATPDDRICVPVPLYHCFGMVGGTLVGLTSGATIVLPAESFEPAATLESIGQVGCTIAYGVPTMFLAMLEHPEFDNTDVSTLRTGIMAGAPCPEELMKQLVSRFHMPDVTIAYGMTETSPVTFQSYTDDPVDKRCGTVGRVVPHAEAKIIDLGGNIVPIGEQGEVLTRGYMVMQGYWDDDEKTNEAVDADGWMHTGDLGTLDEEGWLRITGRVKDMLIRGGENVYPREVEEFLYRHPKIQEVQVFGIPDSVLGEDVAAWIQLREGEQCTLEEIREFCQGEIAHYKIPRHVQFVDEFPMTVTGKIQKFEMRNTMVAEKEGV